ncbi:CoA transferase [Halovulum dunhuangense]|nr:CoA transferase [Halovulum dunhuangense]
MTYATEMLAEIRAALGGDPAPPDRLRIEGEGALPSAFAVTDLATASIAAAGLALAGLADLRGPVRVDRRRASLWFSTSLAPEGWALPPAWDPIAGDYRAADGWIRLHTNAPHHRAAALGVLACAPEPDAVAAAVATWRADALEAAVLEAGGCAAAMRDGAAWAAHPQGRAVAAEPLVAWSDLPGRAGPLPDPNALRPLAGIRVLDLTRILAGPIATRFLAGFGAEVLRIDPPLWEEPTLEPEVTLGKRCARLDLKSPAGRAQFLDLLSGADVLVHGYRPGALDALGLGQAARAQARPGLVDVALCAYGWGGPWAGRRGFDSLVQMSAGIAALGQRWRGAERPVPLPVQALDHATGYLMAAAALHGLARRRAGGPGAAARLSLARTAALLAAHRQAPHVPEIVKPEANDFQPHPEQTPWGPARRLKPAVAIGPTTMAWPHGTSHLGSADPLWARA